MRGRHHRLDLVTLVAVAALAAGASAIVAGMGTETDALPPPASTGSPTEAEPSTW